MPSNIKQLSKFRQLSLNCSDTLSSSSSSDPKRMPFKKQLSEEVMESGKNKIKLTFMGNNKNRAIGEPPPPTIKIAWAENVLPLLEPNTDEMVIVRKCKEIKRPAATKLTRRCSLEKDSILYAKQELTERLKQALKDRREQDKPNLNIFLAHNTIDSSYSDNYNDEYNCSISESISVVKDPPKLMQPLLSATHDKVFHIRKTNKTKMPNTPSSTSAGRSDPMVVVPVQQAQDEDVVTTASRCSPKPIDNVILRPVTAAAKRERFQKRTNSAFHSTVRGGDESIANGVASRPPPLVRSSSAPSRPSDQNKPKFLATKRRIKTGGRRSRDVKSTSPTQDDDATGNNKENPGKGSIRELNRFVAVNGTDIVTMVSLVSPAASDNEDAVDEDKDNKGKTSVEISNNSPSKVKKIDSIKNVHQKTMSLRKTVKSVSFQQSSIHAIRSFSASFPARRSSMASSLMPGGHPKSASGQKIVHEKRATNAASSDHDERGAKRRLVRNCVTGSENDLFTSSFDDENDGGISQQDQNSSTMENSATVAIPQAPEPENETGLSTGGGDAEHHQFASAKEKQCWDMYVKMTDKGVNVSYDTILRGMLTPTEYRMRRKDTVVIPQP